MVKTLPACVMKAGLVLCVLALFATLCDSLTLKGHKRSPDAGGRKSVVTAVNPIQRSAWNCHPGCRKFCLSSCKRSCCAHGAPNYTPDMFPQLVNYQASLPPPPPRPPSCPTGCPDTCYPSCDAGCCFPVQQPAYTQYPASPYDAGYGSYPAGDPCAAQGCSASCAPLCQPDCCRSQALNLSIRPAYLPGSSSPAKPAPKPASKPVKAYPEKKKTKKVKKIVKKKKHIGWVCIPKCQELCKPICRFDCCLPTHKFHRKEADHHKPHKPADKPKPAPKPAPPKPAKIHAIRPVASPQKVPDIIKLVVPPSTPEIPLQDASLSPYAEDFNDPTTTTAANLPDSAGCPGTCPLECSPSCDWSCCSPYIKLTLTQQVPVPQQPYASYQAPQQPALYAAVPPNPMAFYPTPRTPASPGLAPTQPLTCPSLTCPDACAPSCSRDCCEGMQLLPQNWDKRSSILSGK